MSTGARLSRHVATAYADALLAILEPKVERIEVAGSYRRCPDVGDLEFVVIPKVTGVQTDLFGEVTGGTCSCWLALEELRAEGRLRPIKLVRNDNEVLRELDDHWHKKGRPGKDKLFRVELIPRAPESPRPLVELNLADAQTWASKMTIRTGPSDFSMALVQYARTVGKCFHKGRILDGTLQSSPPLDTPREEDIFKVLGLRWIPFKERTGWGAIRAAQINGKVAA